MLRKVRRDRSKDRLIVVSNRLPLVLNQREDGSWEAKPSSGGLVSALVPVLQRRGGVWIGWPGTTDANAYQVQPALEQVSSDYGCTFHPVMLSEEDMKGFYFGFSNEVIWPLFHDLFTNCNFNPSYWQSYREVNRRFANAVADVTEPGDFVWVHDYHLMSLAADMRELGLNVKTGFFLHTPFPPLEIFLKLPWRFDILRGLLEFDTLGFQTLRDRRNFLYCVRTLFNATVEGTGSVVRLRVRGSLGDGPALDAPREISVGAFPIGIDYHKVADTAATEPVKRRADELRADLKDRKIILGVDRLDYTKGLLNRLDAFRHALRRDPELRGKINLVQHVVPSRKEIPDYRQLRLDMEGLIGEINGEFTRSGWVPIHYMFHSLSFEELLAYYRAADIALVTSLKDGMNLVAKEYCAAHTDDDGVLILSEFAGAATQLQKGALLVNPHDIDQTADRICQAYRMSGEERRERMHTMRRVIRTQDVYRWADTFLSVTGNRDLTHIPYTEDYLPRVQ
jgi:trehalose 6-phosphate synthase/phosphatase